MPVTLNTGNVRAGLNRAQGAARLRLSAALYEVGNEVMGTSKTLVPVDTGALKGSGYVALPEDTGNAITVELGYGGPAAPYAIRQHEDLTLNHPDGGQAKFLETPLQAINLPAELAARVTL